MSDDDKKDELKIPNSDLFNKLAPSLRDRMTADTPLVLRSTGMTLTPSAGALTLGDFFSSDRRELEKEISTLKQQIESLLADKKEGDEAKQKISELTSKLELEFLLDKVNQDGRSQLMTSPKFRQLFLGQNDNTPAFVMSIDIRRSTELMLKARNAQAFAKFITELCSELMEIIKNSFGVVDKFTGDGVLAYFPDFYSGRDAAYRAICVAAKCHTAFFKSYANSRLSFKLILKNVGLGIGIDYGDVHLVKIAGGLTVVGEPVVYACRLSAAPAGMTLLNQPAYEKVIEQFGRYCFIKETEITIKHEGELLAYAVELNDKNYDSRTPDWALKTADVGAG